MKKKLLTTLSVVLILGLAALGILAYLTDTDSDVNVMTLGNVQIDLIEQQRADDGQSLVDFEQNKELTPLVGSAQGAKDEFGMPVASNYVDKIVSVKNTGDSDAYVRVLVAVPAALEDSGALHWNLGNKFDPTGNYYDGYVNPDSTDEVLDLTESEDVVLEGIEYNTYVFTYKNPLAKDEVVEGIFVGFYLDSAVDYDGKNYTINGNVIDYDISKGVKVPVLAQAVQAAGFDKVATGATYCATFNQSEGLAATVALDTAFGKAAGKAADWFYEVLGYVSVSDSEELADAIKNGEDVVLTENLELAGDDEDSPAMITVPTGEEVTIDLNNNDLVAGALCGMIMASGEDTVLNIVGGDGSDVKAFTIWANDKAIVNVENVNLTTSPLEITPIQMLAGTVNLDNTDIVCAGTAVQISASEADCTFNMNGGTINCDGNRGKGINVSAGGYNVAINLNAGTINGNQGVSIAKGTGTVTLKIANAFNINATGDDIYLSGGTISLNNAELEAGKYSWSYGTATKK